MTIRNIIEKFKFTEKIIIFDTIMQQIKTPQQLYEQNQRLGHRVNYLNDQNNFYKISINNIKKLNQNINKNLLTTNTKINNTKNTDNKIDPKNITESYSAISNKIQLKNLQMKVGNSKRRVDKLQKLYDGSISTLIKKSDEIEQEINQLSREYEYYTIQDNLLDNIFVLDTCLSLIKENSTLSKPKYPHDNTFYTSIFNNDQKSNKNFRTKHSSLSSIAVLNNIDKIQQLQEEDIKYSNRLEQIIKQEKQLKKQRMALAEKITELKVERQKLANQVYGGKLNLRQAQALEVNQLKIYNKKEIQLLKEIAKQDADLQQQYKVNQQNRQKIMDRNEQQNKEIKVLQQQIKKCSQQVKEIKQKCQNLDTKNKKINKK